MTINAFDLLSGEDIPFAGICTLRVPVLRSLRPKTGIGYDTYLQYLNMLAMDLHTLLTGMGIWEAYEALPAAEQAQYTAFRILTAQQQMRGLLQEALSFFICEAVSFDASRMCFLLSRENARGAAAGPGQAGSSGSEARGFTDSVISDENYETVRSGILQINCLSFRQTAPKAFRNQKAKEIYEKTQKRKAALAGQAKRGDDSMSLPNLIASVAVQHNSYNLTNIWDLTVYQLYDQFARLNMKTQLDVTSLRWAAWGQEPFDFGLWYRDIYKA